MQAALDELRAKLGDQPVDYAELVVLGARVKARRLPDEDQETRQALEEVSEWIRTGSGPQLDLEAADQAKRGGLLANNDE